MDTREALYARVQQALERLHSDLDPAELHGALCGRLCAQPELDCAAVEGLLESPPEPGDVLAAEALEVLQALCRECRAALGDPQMGFAPLLPGDAADNAVRAAALGHWSQAFLRGLAEGGVTELKALSKEAREFVKDLAEIARLGSAYAVQESDEDALALEEVIHYARMGVLLLAGELAERRAGEGRRTLH